MSTYTLSVSWYELDPTIPDHDGQPRHLDTGFVRNYPTWEEANSARSYYLTRWPRPAKAIDVVVSEIHHHEHATRQTTQRRTAAA